MIQRTQLNCTGSMLLASLPILTFIYIFLLQHPFFSFADNFPTPYYPNPYYPVDNFAFYNSHYLYNHLARPNPISPPHVSTPPTSRLQKLVLAFGLGNAIATGAIIVVTVLNIIVYKLAAGRQELDEANISEKRIILSSSSLSEQLCRQFSLSEIQLATNNFDDAMIIGRGGFGIVYKGLIDNGARTVAIKRFNHMSKQGAPEFWNEIEMLSKFRHSHLVSLIGYCNSWQEMILVYEYMVCGTIADHLHKICKNGNSSLSWVQRLKICIGAARGLDYLHTGTGLQHRVIHRDVKSSNILLDENWEAKISDFGMSKIGPANQSCTHISTNVKGTYGYLDPEYFLTRRLTRKSDVYAFGVVLFEVLCGRPAVDLTLNEEQWGLAGWARHCIKEGTLYQNIDPNLQWQILPNSLNAYAKIADQCLHKYPRKRPTMAEVVVWLEFALALQEKVDTSIVEEEITKIIGEKYDHSFTEKQVTTASNGDEQIDGTSSRQSPIKTDRMTITKKFRLMTFTRKGQLGDGSSRQSHTKPSRMTFTGKLRLPTFTRKMRLFFSGKSEKIKNLGRPQFEVDPNGQMLPTSHLRIFSFSELMAATRNFNSDAVVGEGGFGRVYKGLLYENGSGTVIAVKKLNSNSSQGVKEWKSEVEFLGRLSHPNLVTLLGYCCEDRKLLLIYEFMQLGSLEKHLFGGSSFQPLKWDIRVNVLLGAARGLAYLHSLDIQIIYRDFKPSNVLLDESYNVKLSDFGLAKMGPSEDETHVTTQVAGTLGYAAPEYIATGHLNVKSDVYGFGVVLVEMLTGLRARETMRRSGQHNLVDWIKRYLTGGKNLKNIMDPRLEGNYPSKAVVQISQLALKCLKLEHKTRPSMIEVVETLKRIDAVNESPNKGSE